MLTVRLVRFGGEQGLCVELGKEPLVWQTSWQRLWLLSACPESWGEAEFEGNDLTHLQEEVSDRRVSKL